MTTLLGSSRVDEPNLVKLGPTGWAVARKVFYPPQQWTTKDCNAFMAKHLRLVPKQRKELKADLKMERFLKQYEKMPGFQAAFKFKRKMHASARSLHTSMVPMFHLADQLTTIKAEAEHNVEECGAGIASKEAAGATFMGWGQDSVQAVLRPLSSAPKVEASLVQTIQLEDLGLSLEQSLTISARVQALAAQNHLLGTCQVSIASFLGSEFFQKKKF